VQNLLTQQDILTLVPNRYPFLMLDRILELDPGKSGVGLKNVTANEAYFKGHFPDLKVMPGVMVIEACAQLIAVVCRSVGLLEAKSRGTAADWEPSPKIEYIASIERFKFIKPIVPGDQLILEVEVGKKFQQLLRTTVRARVRKDLVAEGVMIATSRS
jgi:3-hydroxyacyl-[acyl-carrier-protein] dehydratase